MTDILLILIFIMLFIGCQTAAFFVGLFFAGKAGKAKIRAEPEMTEEQRRKQEAIRRDFQNLNSYDGSEQ